MNKDIAIIGCGLIGRKRALAFPEQVKKVFDIDQKKSTKLASEINCVSVNAIDEILEDKEIKNVVVATTHDSLFEITKKCAFKLKNVLVEKPGCKNLKEARELLAFQKKLKVKIYVGFNHRFHESFLEIKRELAKKDYGELMFIRGRYGHGGRLGYEKEWRANKKISGGGELVDQGSHLIDLSLFFEDKFKYYKSHNETFFWNMDVEDNAFLMLKSKKSISWLHASWTEWKNLFSFEIYFKKAKFHVEGLGGSYGQETLTKYFMKDEMGIPEIEQNFYDNEDMSWAKELDTFLNSNDNLSFKGCSINELVKIWEIIESSYK